MRAHGGAGLNACLHSVADLLGNEALGNQASCCGELVKSLVTCLSAFENWRCHYNPEKAEVRCGSLNWWNYKWPPFMTESGEHEAENISPWFSFSLSLFLPPPPPARSCKKELEATSTWELLCSLSETHSPCSWWNGGERCLVLTFKWKNQLSLRATEFLYLILPQQADQRYLSVSLWFFYILTAEWKE